MWKWMLSQAPVCFGIVCDTAGLKQTSKSMSGLQRCIQSPPLHRLLSSQAAGRPARPSSRIAFADRYEWFKYSVSQRRGRVVKCVFAGEVVMFVCESFCRWQFSPICSRSIDNLYIYFYLIFQLWKSKDLVLRVWKNNLLIHSTCNAKAPKHSVMEGEEQSVHEVTFYSFTSEK